MSGAKGTVLLGVLGGWFFELHPPCSRQCFLQNWCTQSGAMRDCPQPWTGQPAGFPCIASTPGFVRPKGIVVVDSPRKVEGVVEWGEVLGDPEEHFSHRKVLQFSSWELGSWQIAMKRPRFPFALLSHILYSATLPHRHLNDGRAGGVDDGFGVYSADIGLGYLAWRGIRNSDVCIRKVF
jgi:hypothetical protein